MTSLVDTAQWRLDKRDEALLTGAIYTVHAANPFLATMAERVAARLQIRYDRECMTPASADAPAALKLVQSLLSNSPSSSIQWTEGALLVIDNRRCIHARGTATLPDEDRLLERILVKEL